MNDQATVPQPGDKVTLLQELTLAKRIGKGQLGIVYAAVHEVLARRFAVKVFRAALTQSEEAVRRLRHLIRETSALAHPGIVKLTDFGQVPDGRYYLSMEFVRGIPLSKVLARDGRFPVGRAVPLLIQIADALESAHVQHVVHGDLKPNNMMLLEEGVGERVLLNDFALVPALSPSMSPDDELAHLLLYGNLDYVTPEQIAGGQVDGRADIYSFGATAYRMLTGEPPFVGDPYQVMQAHRTLDPVPASRRSGAHDVPPKLDALLLRCLEKSPTERFDTMEEVVKELQDLLPSREVVLVRRTFEDEETGRWEAPPEEVELLPESPARLRMMFYDTILDLAEHVEEQNQASGDMVEEIAALQTLREEAATIGAQAELTENRFEDIRRELRERESTLRYAIIDLNLAKSDQLDHSAAKARDIDVQIADLERKLVLLGEQRRERFETLNVELQEHKDGLKAYEQQMALHYRRLYAELGEVRPRVKTEESIRLFKRLERCRDALSRTQTAST